MRKNLKRTIILLALLILSEQCGKKQDEETFYRVGNSKITQEEVDLFWMSLPEQMKIQYMDKKGRQTLLNNLVDLELLYQEALRQKLDQEPLIKYKLERSRKNILVQEVVERAVNPDDVYLYYQENYIRLDAIQFPSKEQAEANYALLLKGADFKTIKAKFQPEEKNQDLGYITRETLIDEYGPEAATEVFKPEDDRKFTPPIKTEQGWTVFYLMEKPGSLDPKGLNLVQDEIIEVKQEEVFRGLINDLKNRIPVKPNQKNIDAFLKIGEDWEKAQQTPKPSEEKKTKPTEPSPASGQTVLPESGTTLK